MKTLTERDVAIKAAQQALADARGKLHTLAALGDPEAEEYVTASAEYDQAQTDLVAAFALPEEFDCAFCDEKWDGKGRVVMSLFHFTIHSTETGRVTDEFEFSLGNQRHIVLCPTCAEPLTVMQQKQVQGETVERRAIGEYFNRR